MSNLDGVKSRFDDVDLGSTLAIIKRIRENFADRVEGACEEFELDLSSPISDLLTKLREPVSAD